MLGFLALACPLVPRIGEPGSVEVTGSSPVSSIRFTKAIPALAPCESYQIAFEKRFDDALLDRHDRNEQLTYTVLQNPALRDALLAFYGPRAYGRARVAHQEHCPIGELLSRDEDAHLGRKATFRWDIVRGERSKAIETASLKTLAAFLNSDEGGTLLIGVSEEGEPVGVEPDYATLRKEGQDGADRFELALVQAVLNAVGHAAAVQVTPSRENVGRCDVWRVHVHPSPHPVHAEITTSDKHGQHVTKRRFFVRCGNGTREIQRRGEIQKYIAGRQCPVSEVSSVRAGRLVPRPSLLAVNHEAGGLRRWREDAGIAGLSDEPRPGAPRRIGDDQVEAVIVKTLEERPAGVTHWSTRQMAAATGISRASVARIWAAFGLQPHRAETFKISADPRFIDKVRDAVGLYLDPPERALVLRVDEKSQIQALDRPAPILPLLPGVPERATHDYVRRGTTSLFAALDVASGRVYEQLHARH